MKMKSLLFAAAIFVAGIVSSVAQSNPGSSNGADTELQLTWPDGTIYGNSTYVNDHSFSWGIIGGVYSTDDHITDYNWQETSGGSGHQKDTWTGAVSFNPNDDNLYNWPGGRWPEFGIGTSISLLDGSTNISGAPGASMVFGSINYASSYGTIAFESFQYDHQPQFVMVTGGEAGSTDQELYGITGSAVAVTYGDLPNVNTITTIIPPEQIQIGNLGNLITTGTNYNGIPYGTLYAVLPTHQEVPVTPRANGSKYYYASLNAQGYKLTSTCVASVPTNYSRTTIGVGEEISCAMSPSIAAKWSVSGGGSVSPASPTYSSSTIFTAPSNAASVTVTATFPNGSRLSKIFTVIEPTGYVRAQITGTYNSSYFGTGNGGAGMTNTIWIGPTSVSFYRVSIMEVGEISTDATGYFANTNTYPADWLDHNHHGANVWTLLAVANTFSDHANSGTCRTPWSSGSFSWTIPADWRVGSGPTNANSMTGWNQVHTINSGGTVTVNKFGHTVTRTPSDVITTQ
jgi:hypothetical protein